MSQDLSAEEVRNNVPASPRKMSGRVFVALLLTSLVFVGYGLRVAIQMGQPELVDEPAPAEP